MSDEISMDTDTDWEKGLIRMMVACKIGNSVQDVKHQAYMLLFEKNYNILRERKHFINWKTLNYN